MSDEFKIFFSNHLSVLFENLKRNLFGSSPKPFTRRFVVVYGQAMKSWLMLQMAKDPELGVCAGIEIIHLSDAFEKLSGACQGPSSRYIPSLIEIACGIEREIVNALNTFHSMNQQDQDDWDVLIRYLKLGVPSIKNPLKLTRKVERRIVGLAGELARCFHDYGVYAGDMVAQWEKNKGKPNNWQQKIWNNLFNSRGEWTYPYQLFQRSLIPVDHLEVHFFSISFMCRVEFLFLSVLSAHIPMHYYLLSPCAVFWSDIRSDRESAYLQTYWKGRLGADSPQVLKLEELLRDRNPLPANFGRLGREMARQIDESSALTKAHYFIPVYVEDLEEAQPSHEDVYFIKKDKPRTLLETLQSDILLLRNPEAEPPVPIEADDMSLQLHIAPTKRREIQILYNNLLGIIERDPSVSPSDIRVAAPDILDYMPHIQSIFGCKNSQFDFQLLDVGLRNQSEMVRGFLDLIELGESRWDVGRLLRLFDHPAFQRRHQLVSADFNEIRQWIEDSGIHWGETADHRNELLSRAHCTDSMVEESSAGTWDYGMGRLLTALAVTLRNSRDVHLDFAPCEGVDFSRSELLGKWILLIHSLRDDLAPLHDQSRLTMNDWAGYLDCLLESYFQPDLEDVHSRCEWDDLRAQFDVLRASARAFKETEFSFISVGVHLNGLFRSPGAGIREHRLNAVQFSSMLPLRCVPSKVVALLGMQEGNFPRQKQESSLNLALEGMHGDYYPTSVDYDRHLFLEAIQSTEHTLLISHQGYDPEDGKKLQPSIVVEELLSYLDAYLPIEGRNFSDSRIFLHPFDSFDTAYFQKGARFLNFSEEDFRAAKSHYKSRKSLPHSFLKEFARIEHPQEEILPHRTVIDLGRLTGVAVDPVKFHLNKVLDLYLQSEEERELKNDEELTTGSLDRYLMKRNALKEPIESVLSRASAEGKLPLGSFKIVASQKLEEEVAEVHASLKKHDIVPSDIFQIEFCTGCLKPFLATQDHWVFPALTITYSDQYQLSIVGKLPHVTSKGLLSMGGGALSDAWKMWPQFLLYLHAVRLCPEMLERQLILARHSKSKSAFFDDPEPHLKRLISYYALCTKNFSPLIPDWIPSILNGKPEELKDKMRALFTDHSFGGEWQMLSLRWLLNKDDLPCPERMVESWKGQAEILLGDLVHHWYPPKGEKERGGIEAV
jgi:exodeoxyribonuclease V gamma subunit